MATHNDAIVNTMRRRVIELDGGIVVRDEDQGAYEAPVSRFDEAPEVVSASVEPTSAGVEGLR
jgi:cell division transport system ATP-binding protein